MSRFTLTIDLDNAAFADDEYELRHLIEKAAQRVGAHHPGQTDAGKILDSNGNSVGGWEIH